MADLGKVRPVMFWLFLGGFCWVIGDLFQQYAAKYIGISRGIPLSNTNQLWGLAWGALVFGELAGQTATAQALIVAGSLVMVAGAAAICSAEAPASEQSARRDAMERECRRYGMDLERMEASMSGEDVLALQKPRRHWWEVLVGVAALGIFIWLGMSAERAPITVDLLWIGILSAATLVFLAVCGWLLWRRTRFS
jgi:drug/metabolite transporter (DMT)-like permease